MGYMALVPLNEGAEKWSCILLLLKGAALALALALCVYACVATWDSTPDPL